ncbi:MAG: cupin domain-containing protein [Wenzhouxiangellaceae bacterium]|nr:cupin domain-containing protein [Wenzhouxiangellaceae bacterium]
MQHQQAMDQSEHWFREGCFITEWSNSALDPAASIARARVPAGSTTRWHRLDGITERYVILQGRGRAEIGDAGALAVGPGDVIIIEPGERQRITSIGDGELVFLAVCTPRFRPEAYVELTIEDAT